MLDRIREAEDRLEMTAVLKDLCRLKLSRHHDALHNEVRKRGNAIGMCATIDLDRALDHILDEKTRAEKRKEDRAWKIVDAFAGAKLTIEKLVPFL